MSIVSQIQIKNFKSIVDLTLDLGRVNLFIGENGSGKSNILEAVAFASSTSNNRINNSVLVSKGVRITKPELYSNAFVETIKDIHFQFLIDENLIEAEYEYKNGDEKNWLDVTASEKFAAISNFLIENISFIEFNKHQDFSTLFTGPTNFVFNNVKIKEDTPTDIKSKIEHECAKFEKYFNYRYYEYFTDFIIYSPEVSSLRKFEEEGQTTPLGAHGEGLFNLIKSMASENGNNLQHIKEHLEVIDWFENFSIPNDLMSNEYKISIKDRFINSDIKYLDQRSANEGFLFLLFYIVLFSSRKTPQFFAIDNIEASFNPKLCSKLINMLTELSKKNGKQVLMTTHNPATLDGLNLNDPEQRLFVVRRNIDGHTIVSRIAEKPKVSTPMKLSEMWTKGLLGGLPDNF